MIRCDFTDLNQASCAHCQGHDAFPEVQNRHRLAVTGAWLTARYDGKCAGCGDWYPRGTRIRSDGGAGWLAGCCTEEDQ